MSGSHVPLRLDSPNYPSFLMMHRPPPLSEAQQRAAEWLMATWVCMADSNIHGVRRVAEERNGQLVPMVHIAIPLGYQRRQLAQTLGIEQIDDDQATPRVNLAGSNGFDEPHSYIRVPLENVIKRFTAFMHASAIGTEINDETLPDPPIPGTPVNVVEEYEQAARLRRRDDDHRLRSALRHALAMRNADIDPDHIQTLINRHTREKWIRIKNVDRGARTAVRMAIKRAGIRTAALPTDGDPDWAVLFPESEARKLLS
jgi:hypothetical protein